MGVDRVLPARDPPIRVETVYESERTRVTRLFLAGRTVIRKEPLGPDGEARLRHEVAILERLRGVAGVAQLADAPGYPGSIMLEDVDGACLATVSLPLATDAVLSLAADLAGVVAGMHRRGVMHTDIGPANILLSGPGRSPCLIDFALASSFAEIRPKFTHHSEIVGTLAYLAPEQTGRTGRPVDQRADLYALGATLYELATGGPPFGSGDALRLTRDHLARVPVEPHRVNPAVPTGLSEVIMHLLEKEPDRRYQSAEGLVHDLIRPCDDRSSRAIRIRLGEHDVPLRLLPPSRPVGRDAQIAALGVAFADAQSGRCRGVLVSGPAGVGKSTLIDELRPVVTAADGWFVAGKFDQYRRDLEFDGVFQAFRGLGRLLLAEPEDELAELRQRMLRALGPNAGLVTAVVPEFAVLLNVPPDPGDPTTTQARAPRTAVEILRAVVSRKRPMVLVVDDLQWADRTSLGIIDAVLTEDGIDGLLVVGAYRDDGIDAGHPLTGMLSRWQRHDEPGQEPRPAGPELIRLGNLTASSQATLFVDMLRLPTRQAAGLAKALAPHTNGNPYDTIELLNALRQRGVLTSRAGRWQWEDVALGSYLADIDVADVLVVRIDAMPEPTRRMLQAMACLGGRVEIGRLQAATGQSAATVERRLAPALDDGLLVIEPGPDPAVRFRHDRIRELILHRLGPDQQHDLELAMARRLAPIPDLFAVAAHKYLPVIDLVHDADERRMVTGLLRRAVEQAEMVANHDVVEKLLAGALRLADPADRDTLIELHTRRHAALYSVGRLDEADQVYATIEQLATSAIERADATVVQVNSLTARRRGRQAVDLGAELLRQLGTPVPTPQELPAEIERGVDALHRWLDESDEADDLRHPEITDPAIPVTATVIKSMLPAAYFAGQTRKMMSWLALQAVRILAEHGPGPTLIGPAATISTAVTALRQDYRTGYRAARRVLALGEARGYEPGTSVARLGFALASQWVEPLEDCVGQVQQVHEALIRVGDLAYAGYATQLPVPPLLVPALLDCTSSLDNSVKAVDSALAFASRTGNQQIHDWMGTYRWMVARLRGEGVDDDVASPQRYASNPPAVAYWHINRAFVAAVFGDDVALAEHTGAVMPLLPAIVGTYPVAVAHLLRALALAHQIRTTPGDDHTTELAELDEVVDWLARRATDAPANFLHLLRLVEAERAWAVGDLRAALHAFDAAQREVASRRRPWHRALIAERAAQFYLADGLEHAGYALLAEARSEYEAWGASAKVDDLDWSYPALHAPAETSAAGRGQLGGRPARRRASVMTGTINLLGVLSASQALSSETSIDGLRNRVGDVLSAMTGATGVHLLLHSQDQPDWWHYPPGRDAGSPIGVDEAGRRGLLPMSVFRYAERIREPLVVTDAIRDDRFARDPYFTDIDCCSLLAVPILNRGRLQALLLLENRLIRAAFSAERLDGVMLIAGQLAVSLDNAMIYANLERKVAERTNELAHANARLEQLSITDPLTGLANRRHLQDVLTTEWRDHQHTRQPIALAMIDIDHFKLYNDHYGHAAGDRCLQQVAHELAATIRSTDHLARYGGEELAVVMPDTDITTAHHTAEHLRTAIEHLAIPGTTTGERILTISIGVAATTPTPHTNPNHLIEQADTQLYRAKHNGRNQVQPAAERTRSSPPTSSKPAP